MHIIWAKFWFNIKKWDNTYSLHTYVRIVYYFEGVNIVPKIIKRAYYSFYDYRKWCISFYSFIRRTCFICFHFVSFNIVRFVGFMMIINFYHNIIWLYIGHDIVLYEEVVVWVIEDHSLLEDKCLHSCCWKNKKWTFLYVHTFSFYLIQLLWTEIFPVAHSHFLNIWCVMSYE